MYEYRVELKEGTNGWTDYASFYFNVYACTDVEAWEKAAALEDERNIRKICAIRFLGEREVS